MSYNQGYGQGGRPNQTPNQGRPNQGPPPQHGHQGYPQGPPGGYPPHQAQGGNYHSHREGPGQGASNYNARPSSHDPRFSADQRGMNPNPSNAYPSQQRPPYAGPSSHGPGVTVPGAGPQNSRDPRADPRIDPRVDPRIDPRVDPRADSRVDPRVDPRADPRADPRTDPRVDPRLNREPRGDPRDAASQSFPSRQPPGSGIAPGPGTTSLEVTNDPRRRAMAAQTKPQTSVQPPPSQFTPGPASNVTLHQQPGLGLGMPPSTSSSSITPLRTIPNPDKPQLSLALVCHSNVNRSMEGHKILADNGYKLVYSYGAGSKVRLPGEAIDKPNVYEFGTPYSVIVSDLRHKNQSRYTRNGMLNMISRDAKVKLAPERFQDTKLSFDIVIAYETRVYEIAQEDLLRKSVVALAEGQPLQPCFVINLETTDNHAEARNASIITLDLINEIHDLLPNIPANTPGEISSVLSQFSSHLPDPAKNSIHAEPSLWIEHVEKILDKFENRTGKPIYRSIVWC